jgi:hypothetical protein
VSCSLETSSLQAIYLKKLSLFVHATTSLDIRVFYPGNLCHNWSTFLNIYHSLPGPSFVSRAPSPEKLPNRSRSERLNLDL